MATIMRVGGGAGGGKAPEGKPVSGLSVGDIITITESGMPVHYRIVHKGLPSSIYDSSCDGVWVTRESLHSSMPWDSDGSNNDYEKSTVHEYLNGAFLNQFTSETRKHIKQVKLPYVKGTGNGSVVSGFDGLPAKVFLLSGVEVGFTTAQSTSLPLDGVRLEYFSSNARRVAYYGATASVWWTRSPYLQNTGNVWTVKADGAIGGSAYNASGLYIRNAMVLENTTLVNLTPNDDGSYSLVSDAVTDIFGIARDITASSPEWVRTDGAVAFKATASVGTMAGESSFDNIYPWSEMKRVTLDTGDVMVRIPKFYYGRYRNGNIERIQISGRADVGLTLHPAFNHAGVEQECVYVGAYKAGIDQTVSSNWKATSKSGVAPMTGGTRQQFRLWARAKGAGWSLIDISTLSAIQMLYLVEFANNNSQAMIGRGVVDSTSGVFNTGTADAVPNLTGRPAGTDGNTDVVYRGIEGFWGNVWEFVDGFNYYSGNLYACNDPSKYADNTSTGYDTQMSYTVPVTLSGIYISKMGLDTKGNPHIMLPESASGGSESTYYCDAGWSSSSGWMVYLRGGEYSAGSKNGMFCDYLAVGSSGANTSIGSRLIYIPQ